VLEQGRVSPGDRVVFVHGKELVQWLRSRPAVHGRERVDALVRSLDGLRAGRAANPS
jgi:hypothetical protein